MRGEFLLKLSLIMECDLRVLAFELLETNYHGPKCRVMILPGGTDPHVQIIVVSTGVGDQSCFHACQPL